MKTTPETPETPEEIVLHHCDICEASHAEQPTDTQDGFACESCLADFTPCSDCAEEHRDTDTNTTARGRNICDSCVDDHYFRCTDCDDLRHTDDVYNSRGDQYCESCYDSRFVTCDDCGDSVDSSDVRGTQNNSSVCDDCIDSNYSQCESCNSYIRAGQTCNSRNCTNNVIHSYSYRPTPYFNLAKDEKKAKFQPFAGIEIEFECMGGNREKQAKDSTEKNLFYVKTDGSLDDGLEVVSHPLSQRFIQENDIFNFTCKLKNSGARSYNTTTSGIHVHLSKNAFTTWQLYRLLKFFNDNKKFILMISQRKEEQLNRWAGLTSNERRTLISYAKRKYQDNRYSAINMQPSNTIEFRIFRGTLRKESILKNLEFCFALFYFTQERTEQEMKTANFISFINEDRNKKQYKHLIKFLSNKPLINF